MAFMRHNNNGRRHNNNRHRHTNNGPQQGQRRHVNRINQVFESNGPEGRVRGTAQQIVEKYLTMARDARGSGDRVLSMNYFQHAEHYQRLLNEIQEENTSMEREREAQRAAQQAAQPDIAEGSDEQQGNTAQDSDTHNAASEQPQKTRQPRQPRSVVSRSAPQPRQPRRKDNAEDDDLNALPSFLQVPITELKPSAEPAKADAKVDTKVDTKNDSKDAEKAPAPRVVRTRRVASAAKESTAEKAPEKASEKAAE